MGTHVCCTWLPACLLTERFWSSVVFFFFKTSSVVLGVGMAMDASLCLRDNLLFSCCRETPGLPRPGRFTRVLCSPVWRRVFVLSL